MNEENENLNALMGGKLAKDIHYNGAKHEENAAALIKQCCSGIRQQSHMVVEHFDIIYSKIFYSIWKSCTVLRKWSLAGRD